MSRISASPSGVNKLYSGEGLSGMYLEKFGGWKPVIDLKELATQLKIHGTISIIRSSAGALSIWVDGVLITGFFLLQKF